VERVLSNGTLRGWRPEANSKVSLCNAMDVQTPTPAHTSPCVQHAAKRVIHHTPEQSKKNTHTLMYPSVCVRESQKQQRVDGNVPRQLLRSVRGPLNAVTGSRYGRALRLFASLAPHLCSSIPRSRRHCRCHQRAMMRGKPWRGTHAPHPRPEREQGGQ